MSSIVFFLILTTITFAGHVHSQRLSTATNIVAVGSNVTISSDTRFTLGALQLNNNILAIVYPGGQTITNAYKDKLIWNSNTSALTIISATLNYSGVYTFNQINEFIVDLTITVEEPITNATVTAQRTSLVEFNDTAVLTCSVATGSPLSFIWLDENSTIINGGNAQLSNKNAILTIPMVTRYNQGPYRCNVSNDIGYEVSPPLQLNISYGPENTIMTIRPERIIYKTGSNISLSCSAESSPSATIQWMFNDTYLNQHGPQLNLEDTNESHSGIYKCLSYNAVTLRYSSASSWIQIMDPITAVVVRQTDGPAILHDSFSLTCDITGLVDSILWWKDGQPISADNSKVFDITNKTLTLNPVQISDNGYYMCKAFNFVSDLISSPYKVIINYGPDTPIIVGPQAVLRGNSATLSCSAHSVPPSVFSWHVNGSLVSDMPEYITPPLYKDIDLTYICVAFNNITGKSSNASITLIVIDPIENVQVEAQINSSIEGDSYELTCNTIGPVDFIYWMKNNEPLQADNRIIFSMDNKTITFIPVDRSDSGNYQCEAFNAVDNMTSEPYNLIVNYGPEMITIMGRQLAKIGDSVTLRCYAASIPSSQYKWYLSGSLISNVSEFITPPLSKSIRWEFTCVAFNDITNKNSTTSMLLTVIDPIENVQVEAQINSSIEGDSYELTCNTIGPVDFIYWMKNGEPLQADNRIIFSMDNKTITFIPVDRSDSGNYQCEAFNAVENMTSAPYNLIVNFGPETPIIYGPTYGETRNKVEFICDVLSVPPSSFSWWFNGTKIANTSVLNVGPLTLNMSGKYTCMASNNVTGKNSTNSTILTVIETITSVTIINSTRPINNVNFTLTCQVLGLYDAIYWMKDGMILSRNASSTNSSMYRIENNTLHFIPATVQNNGTYQCVAVNKAAHHPSPDYILRVNYGPLSVYISGPTTTKATTSGTGNVSLKCSAESHPDCAFRWFLNKISVPVGSGPVLTFIAGKQNEGNYICEATNPVTNLTLTQTKTYSVAGHASATLIVSKGGLMFVGLCALSAHWLFL